MQKSEVRIEEPVIPVENNRKTKTNKHVTVCKDKRRDPNHCGHCGSDEIAEQGVIYCTMCHSEKEYLIGKGEGLRGGRWYHSDYHEENRPCDCWGKSWGPNNRFRQRPYIIKIVYKCMTCGSTGTISCPKCKDGKTKNWYRGKSWVSKLGDRFCQTCGFRSKGATVI